MAREPRLRRSAKATLLLRADHLDRVDERRVRLGLDLDEDELPAAADDQVELVAARPRVRGQDAVAADEVMPPRAPLDRRARGAGAQSSPAQ